MIKRLVKHKNLILFVICLILLSACATNSNEKTEDTSKSYELTSEQTSKVETLLEVIPISDDYEIETLDNQDKLFLAFELLAYENTDHETHIRNEYENSKKSLEDIFSKYFGNSNSMTMEDLVCHYCGEDISFSYNEKKEVFKEEPHGHGYSVPLMFYEIVGAKQKDDTIIVDVKKIFTEVVGEAYESPKKIYATANDAYNEENLLVDIRGSNYCDETDECDYDAVLKDYINKLNTYEYIFELQDDDLVFIKYQLKK